MNALQQMTKIRENQMWRFILMIGACYFYSSIAWGDNLIVNGDFENGDRSFTSAYKSSTGNLVDTKRYDVVTGGAGDLGFDNPAFTLFGDHTSGRGLFLAANGATDKSMAWGQTVTLEANTLYGFTTWVSTLFPLSPASLQFSINGVQIGQDYAAPATAGVWAQFTGTYFSGAGGATPITITDLNTAAAGNDFGLDDISLATIATVPPIPEPGTGLLFAAGLAIIGFARSLARPGNYGLNRPDR
jgi:hypothetical protein